jgi:hypothetical protein
VNLCGWQTQDGKVNEARLSNAATAIVLYRPGEMAEWLKAHAWKACVPQGTVGSNPTLSAIKTNKGIRGKNQSSYRIVTDFCSLNLGYPDVDLDGKTYSIKEHLDLGFMPKDSEEGTIRISDSVVEILRARRRRCPTGRSVTVVLSCHFSDVGSSRTNWFDCLTLTLGIDQ